MGLVAWIVCWRMFLILGCFMLPVCVAAPFAVGVLARLLAWIACWRMFLNLCCFLFPSVCDFCVSSGGSSGTSGVDCVLEDVSNTRLFSVSHLCVAALCALRVLAGLVARVVCWRMVLIFCCFMLPNVCGGCVCSGGSSATGGVDCVLEDVSNTMLLSVACVCCGSVCSGGSSGTVGMDCVLEDVSKFMLFSVP